MKNNEKLGYALACGTAMAIGFVEEYYRSNGVQVMNGLEIIVPTVSAVINTNKMMREAPSRLEKIIAIPIGATFGASSAGLAYGFGRVAGAVAYRLFS